MTISRDIRLPELQVLLDKTFGRGAWIDWEPGTVLVEFQCSEPLVMEKVYVLKGLNKALNSIMSLPEFVLWATSICNNDPAEFETFNIPSCLELAWMISEVKRVALIIGQAFEPTEDLVQILAYLLRLEGFSKPHFPFEFIPESYFESGQTNEDMRMKDVAIKTYIAHMEKMSGFSLIKEPASV